MNRHPLDETLPRFSLKRRVAVLVLLATTVVVGVVAALRIPLELIPAGFSPPFLAVQAPWPDAPAQEVIDKIILPLEEELSTVRGIDSLISVARLGSGRVFMNFKGGTDMDVAYREVRDRIERARPRMPDDLERVYIRKEDQSAIPVLVIGLAIDSELSDPYSLVQNEVIMRLERIDGVANVEAQGLLEKEIFIELDRERTEASGLNIYQLAQELGGDNFSMASGDVRYGDSKLLLRSVARFDDLEALRNRLVAPRVRLKDVGSVSYKEPERKFRVRANSQPAIALVVFKEGQANTLEVAERVRAEIATMRDLPRLQDVGIVTIFDQGRVIQESLGTLLDSGRIGGLFAIVVLFFFLKRLRLTLIIAMSIPLSLLIGLTVMFFAGESLNILSLLGLMISVGLLVDNSVVVAENIHRLHIAGLSRRNAAIRGTAEIMLAIIMATLTTIVVFLPVSLVEGQAQFFLLRLSLPICVSLAASLMVAGIFVPLSVYLTLKNGETKTSIVRTGYQGFKTAISRAYEMTLGRLNRGYTRLLKLFLRRRIDLVIVLLVVFGVTVSVAFKEVKIVDSQDEERSGFEIDVHMPRATTLEEAEAFFLECEAIVEGLQEELGLSGWFLVHRATYGEVQGFFTNPRTSDLTPREATERVLELLPEKPGVSYYTGQESENDESGEQVHIIALYGEDAAQLDETAEQLEEQLTTVEGVLGVKSAGDPTPNEVALVIDRDRAQQQGINPQVVAGVVGYALRGQPLNRFFADGKDIPVRIRFREDDRESLNQLKGFFVPTGEGAFAPLSSVTDVSYTQPSQRIFRRDKRVTRTITLELEQGKEKQAREAINARVAGFNLPEGMRFGAAPRSNAQEDDLAAMKFAASLSIVFIYLLMGFLFESFILPLSIICTIPLAAIGVGWTHFFAGYDLDFLGLVGVVLLIGVVVNNGIVLIDYVNRLRGEGLPRTEALLLAAERRFRPILMTALTTICGMIPVTLSGASSIGISYTSFGLTLIGGLTTATLLTLLVVPIFYTFFDDASEAVRATLRRVLRGRASAEDEVQALVSD